MSKWGSEEKETIEAIEKIGFKGKILNIAAGDGRFNEENYTTEQGINIFQDNLVL